MKMFKKTNKINEEVILAYSFKNALEHEGKARKEAVLSSLFHEGLQKKDIKKILPEIEKAVDKVNKLSLNEQEKEFFKLEKKVGKRKEREGLPELPHVSKKGVIMRFRPAPSGPLHIGHIISNLISSLYVKKYRGKFYVIVDDTNPQEIEKEYYKKIKEDCDWIFGNVYKYINSSERMKIYYKYALKLIEKGKAYVCNCNPEKFKKLIDNKKPCPCRELSIKENLARWKKMLDKKGYKEGQAVLRFKSSLESDNPAFRDFPLARINETKHPLQGKKYRVWPLMNLAVSADDIELGMTHVIRGKDHLDNAERQKMIYRALGKEKHYPWTFFMGRIKFSDLVLSKRKINSLIKSGKFSGWDDPRIPTISSLRKRGYKKEAFEKLIIQRGLNSVDKVISQKDFFSLLDNFSKWQT